ncbi:MAG: choice-of-anchor X domain-containing protein, partial [Candidatus Thermoplasmatota archaeon]
GPLGASGATWRPGEVLDLVLSAPIPSSSNVNVGIVDDLRGETIATAHLNVPAPPPTATSLIGFTLIAAVNGSTMPTTLPPSSPFRLDATIDHPDGRKFLRYAYADLSGIGGPAWVQLADDGTGGDRVASDGVYGSLLQVPTFAWPDGGSVTLYAVDLDGNRVSAPLALGIVNAPVPPTVPTPQAAPLVPPAPLAPLAPVVPSSPTPVVPANATPTGPSSACANGTASIASRQFLANGATTLTGLRNQLAQGEHVQAQFTLIPGCTDFQVTLVSYRAPTPTFSQSNADQQVVYQSQTATFGPGTHTLDVDVPPCYYRVDFVTGPVITQLGPANTNNFYSPQGRLIDADNGGIVSCPAGLTSPATSGPNATSVGASVAFDCDATHHGSSLLVPDATFHCQLTAAGRLYQPSGSGPGSRAEGDISGTINITYPDLLGNVIVLDSEPVTLHLNAQRSMALDQGISVTMQQTGQTGNLRSFVLPNVASTGVTVNADGAKTYSIVDHGLGQAQFLDTQHFSLDVTGTIGFSP